MKLEMIPVGRLDDSDANIRAGRKRPDISDLLPSVIKRGVLQSLLVREEGTPGRFGVVAGRRRLYAARAAAEQGALSDVPCAILEAGDDADAVEASLLENCARADLDDVSLWESFVRLVKAGRGLPDIAATFRLPEPEVRRILALGDLQPRIRDLYRRGEIDASTLRHLTLATKKQQTAWLALFGDADANCPMGQQLKAWLFGGAAIRKETALFDIDAYKGRVVADLFGEAGYFDDAEAFWTLQNRAIEARKSAYLDAGWSDVVVMETGAVFHSWQFVKTGKKKGGRVYIETRPNGEVVFHEGYATAREAKRLAAAETPEAATKAARPEITGPMRTYIDLHRHAALRAAMLDRPGVALRLMTAHAIAGSPLWTVRPERQQAGSDAVAASLAASPAEARFAARRRAVLALLGFDEDETHVVGGDGDDDGLAGVFAKLLALADAEILEVIGVVMGETLASGSAVIELAGLHLGLDMARCWSADEAFLDLIRDGEVLTALLSDIAGRRVATAHASDKGANKKAIIRDCLSGANGRDRTEGWVPKWMQFPPAAYTKRGGVAAVDAHARIAGLLPRKAPDNAAQKQPRPAPEAEAQAAA